MNRRSGRRKSDGPMIIENPTPPRSLTTAAEKEAYRDGWNAAANNAPRHGRPGYPTHGEREAFNLGWDTKNIPNLL
jgi:hypothetical protein